MGTTKLLGYYLTEFCDEQVSHQGKRGSVITFMWPYEITVYKLIVFCEFISSQECQDYSKTRMTGLGKKDLRTPACPSDKQPCASLILNYKLYKCVPPNCWDITRTNFAWKSISPREARVGRESTNTPRHLMLLTVTVTWVNWTSLTLALLVFDKDRIPSRWFSIQNHCCRYSSDYIF